MERYGEKEPCERVGEQECCANSSSYLYYQGSLNLLLKYLAPHLLNDLKVSKYNVHGHWNWWDNIFRRSCWSSWRCLTVFHGEKKNMLTFFPSILRHYLQRLVCSSGIWGPTELMPESQLSNHVTGWPQLFSAEYMIFASIMGHDESFLWKKKKAERDSETVRKKERQTQVRVEDWERDKMKQK